MLRTWRTKYNFFSSSSSVYTFYHPVLPILGLYVLTVFLTFIVNYSFDLLVNFVTGTDIQDDYEEMTNADLRDALILIFLSVAALLMFAVLPAVAKGSLLRALGLALIFSLVSETVGYVTNLSFVKELGWKEATKRYLFANVTTLIVAVGSYYMAWYILT